MQQLKTEPAISLSGILVKASLFLCHFFHLLPASCNSTCPPDRYVMHVERQQAASIPSETVELNHTSRSDLLQNEQAKHLNLHVPSATALRKPLHRIALGLA